MMRKTRGQSGRYLLLSFIVLALAACGGATPNTQPAAQSAAALASPQSSANASPSASTASATVAASGEAEDQATATQSANAAATPAQSVAASGKYAGLEQSRTPEGYYALGNADAPAIINHYSDFI